MLRNKIDFTFKNDCNLSWNLKLLPLQLISVKFVCSIPFYTLFFDTFNSLLIKINSFKSNCHHRKTKQTLGLQRPLTRPSLIIGPFKV